MKIYLHKACFDGVASAAIAIWMLQRLKKEELIGMELVDYDVGRSWPMVPLDSGACVVDFLYHPDAVYWWDHHETSFFDAKLQRHYEKRRSATMLWDPNMPSCAGLIANCASQLGERPPSHLLDTVHWADKLDSASYDSAEEAVQNKSAARQIALSFRVDSSLEYHRLLIRSMQNLRLDEIVKSPPFRERSVEALQRYSKGLELMHENSRLEQDIVLYDLTLGSEIVDRMMPFFLFPEANYSLGIWRNPDQTKVTCNASPWRKPSGPNLGRVFAQYGGGGHRDVGSVILPRKSDTSAEKLLREIADAIQTSRKESKKARPAMAGRS
jgi:hypothetical protein